MKNKGKTLWDFLSEQDLEGCFFVFLIFGLPVLAIISGTIVDTVKALKSPAALVEKDKQK